MTSARFWIAKGEAWTRRSVAIKMPERVVRDGDIFAVVDARNVGMF